MVGDDVGATLGDFECPTLGRVGVSDGPTLGSKVGVSEGPTLGNEVGDSKGFFVGPSLGVFVGP